MPVSFSQIPPNLLLPLFYAEITQARHPISSNLKLCLIGQMNKDERFDEGIAVANTPYLCSGDDVNALFGPGSMLSWMYGRARNEAPFAEIWAIAIPERDQSLRSIGSVTMVKGGTANRRGIAGIHIAGRPVQWLVEEGDATDVLAARLSRQINQRGLPVKANATGSVVELTCRWAGDTGNSINITYTGPRGPMDQGEASPTLARSICNITKMGGVQKGEGEANPTAAFDVLLDRPFDVFVTSGGGTTYLNGVHNFMDKRWGPFYQLYGHVVHAEEGILQELHDLGEAHNDPHTTILGIKQSIFPMWEWAASLAAIMTVHWAAPPELSRPLQTLELHGLYVGDDDADSFSKEERQRLLEQGISTFHVNPDTTCRIDRVRTLRKLNDWLDPDPSWADAITMFQAMYFVRTMRAAITGTYPRAALTDFPTGINGFTSPDQIRNLVIHEYSRMMQQGLVENLNLFAQYLVVERDIIDANRVNLLMRPDMVNQLRVVAALVETHLELDEGRLAAA